MFGGTRWHQHLPIAMRAPALTLKAKHTQRGAALQGDVQRFRRRWQIVV